MAFLKLSIALVRKRMRERERKKEKERFFDHPFTRQAPLTHPFVLTSHYPTHFHPLTHCLAFGHTNIRICTPHATLHSPKNTDTHQAEKRKIRAKILAHCGLTVAAWRLPGTNAGSKAARVHDQTENEDHPRDRERQKQERRGSGTRTGQQHCGDDLEEPREHRRELEEPRRHAV